MTVPADGSMTTAAESKPQPALGFLTILEHEVQGLVGGYLILNTVGRPLEFHCTAPVKANRAQQILFGPTLDAYLYGEQIGQTLLGRSTLDLLAVCTDVERALCVRDYVAHPVALVLADRQQTARHGLPAPSTAQATGTNAAAGANETPQPAMTTWRVDAAQRPAPHLAEFSIGHNRLAVGAHRDADRTIIIDRLQGMAAFDLAEPFERIRQAVEEAHKSGRAATS